MLFHCIQYNNDNGNGVGWSVIIDAHFYHGGSDGKVGGGGRGEWGMGNGEGEGGGFVLYLLCQLQCGNQREGGGGRGILANYLSKIFVGFDGCMFLLIMTCRRSLIPPLP